MKIKKIIGITLTTLLLSSTVFANTTTYQAVSNPFGLYINGKAITSDQPILNYNNFTYVPLRLVSQNLNASVDLNNNNIVINTNDNKNNDLEYVQGSKIYVNDKETNYKVYANQNSAYIDVLTLAELGIPVDSVGDEYSRGIFRFSNNLQNDTTKYTDLFYLYEALSYLKEIDTNAIDNYTLIGISYNSNYKIDGFLNNFKSLYNDFYNSFDREFCNKIASLYNINISEIFNKLDTKLNKIKINIENVNLSDTTIINADLHQDIINLENKISKLIYN